MKEYFVIGNWKCNPKSLEEANKLYSSLNQTISRNKKIRVVVCPPFTFLSEKLKKLSFDLGAQDCFWKEGSFTGEVSVAMLKSLNCGYVIIGHSERRNHFQEKTEMIIKKLKACLNYDLVPILCIDKISQLEDLKEFEKEKVIIAYEPLSAIGRGEAISYNKATEMRLKIQKELGENQIILYGGSVDYNNVVGFIKKSGFQGVLVGEQSLNSENFAKIIKKIEEIT